MNNTLECADLYCGHGGAAKGLMRAGFKVCGYDIEDYKTVYPTEFRQRDCTHITAKELRHFDLVWASPPCQAYTWAAQKHVKKGKIYPDLIKRTRQMLIEANVPYILENVPAAPIR